jgi:hypothetical protein
VAACELHTDRVPVTRCSLCHSAICDECYAHTADSQPACPKCAYLRASHKGRRVSLAVSSVGIAWGTTFLLLRRGHLDEDQANGGVVVALIVTVVALIVGYRAFTAAQPTIVARERDADDTDELEFDDTHKTVPYRLRMRRALPPPRPRVSAASTVLLLLASLGLAALSLPKLLDLPRWLEAESVLGVWWLLWTFVLGFLLYRGYRLKDDWHYFTPWEMADEDSCWPTGCDGGDGCLLEDGAILIVVAVLIAALVVGAAWVLVEVALPLVFLIAYSVLARALRRVAHDDHGCERQLGRAFLWGAVWSTIYLLPIAGLIYGVHALMR